MSYYYKYNFTSPEGIFAIVKEELKSYFDTGAVDDLMFNTYLNKALDKLGKSSYSIVPEILYVENFEARLPDNFKAIREAWYCVDIPLRSYQSAVSFYSQTSSTTIQIAPLMIAGEDCTDPSCPDSLCEGNVAPEISQAVYKTNSEISRSYKIECFMTPGNISARKFYDNDCSYTIADPLIASNKISPYSAEYKSFDIRDNKFVTMFREGTVYILFYAYDYDVNGNQMIPDNYRIKEYIEAYLKYKMFETITNQVMDETYKQLEGKLERYERMYNEAYIIAKSEIQKQDVWQKQRAIKAQRKSFNMYELPNRTSRFYGWRRNM